MKLKVTTYRTVSIRVSDLLCQIGVDYERDKDMPMAAVIARFREASGPFHPGFKVFWPTATCLGEAINYRAIAGMEVMNFDILDVKVGEPAKPTAGVVLMDPMDPTSVNRLDGALEGELNRIGVATNYENFEYRSSYEFSGN